jgi:hypothetical protein
MTELVRLYAQIALMRRGPQDLPALPLVLAMTVVAYFAVNSALSYVLPPLPVPWLLPLAFNAFFIFVWYAILLRLAGRGDRFVQTTSAVFGVHTVVSPFLIALAWASGRVEHQSTWQFPLVFLSIVLIVWVVAANTHILRQALEWSMLTCVGLVVLRLAVSELLFYVLFWPTR